MDPRPSYHLFLLFSLCHFLDCDYIINDTCEYVNNKPKMPKMASLRGCLTFSSSQTGVSLQENTAKNRNLPVVTFCSPPPPNEPASHRRFRHQPRSQSPTHLHTSTNPHLSDFSPLRHPQKPVPPHAPFCANSPTPHLAPRHIPQKRHPKPTLLILHNRSIANIFKNIMSHSLDICTPIWYNKYSKTH